MRQLASNSQKQDSTRGEKMSGRICWWPDSADLPKRTFNPIRSIIETCKLEPCSGKSMIALSIGDPTVFGNLNPPKQVMSAVMESVESMKYNGYANSTGVDIAREAVAKYSSTERVTYHSKDIILTNGCSAALDYCIACLANPGQNILVPSPGFPVYRTLGESLAINLKSYNLIPTKSWEIDLDHLQSQIDKDTVAILINNPSNPCGSVFSAKHLKDILRIASSNYLPIIADEIYEYMVFEGLTFYPIAEFSEEVPILTCSGLTKRFLVPGWRMGWIKIHDPKHVFIKEVRSGLVSISQKSLGCNTLVQGAMPKILTETPQEFFQDTICTIQKNANLAYSLMSEIKGLNPIMPQGAMYMMVGIDLERFPLFKTTLELIEQMVREESVFCLPGICFNYPNYMRLVLTLPDTMLLEACKRMNDFCNRHYHDGITKVIEIHEDTNIITMVK